MRRNLCGLALALILALAASTALAAEGRKPGDYAKNLTAEAAKKVKVLPMAEVKDKLKDKGLIFLDVRTEVENKKGFIPNSLNIPRGLLEFMVEEKIPNPEASIIVYCKKGGRGLLAALTLQEMGYKNVQAMKEGFDDWVKAGYPVGD